MIFQEVGDVESWARAIERDVNEVVVTLAQKEAQKP